MEKEVLIHIKTQQVVIEQSGIAQEEPDVVEVMVPGEYYQRNGVHYLMYEELMEGFTEPVHNMTKIRPGILEVRKKGVVTVNMVFEKNKTHVAFYQTPFGTIHMGICPSKVVTKTTDSCVEVSAEYVLSMNETPVAQCVMQMRVTPKEDKGANQFFKS